MFGVKKRKILSWLAITNLLFSCNQPVEQREEFSGEAQGTTYSIIVTDDAVHFTKDEIDSIFLTVDNALSTYVPTSVISQLNNADSSITIQDPSGLFERCYSLSQHIYSLSEGAFDPSVFPLVEGWGFMSNMNSPLEQQQVDSIMQFVSFEKGKYHTIDFIADSIRYDKKQGFKLDFNAIAQGLTVDVIKEFLLDRGQDNFYIEVGGEIYVHGVNAEGEKWRIGVDAPIENATSREIESIIHISNKSIATSGNYRKFYEVDGKKYAHTLDPKTGFPVQHSLLSATVVAEDVASADAYATVFMVIGEEKAFKFMAAHPEEGLDAYFLIADKKDGIKRSMTKGFEDYHSQD